MSPRFFTPTLLLRKSDADLARLAGEGSDAAFAAIVLRHRAALLRRCRGLLRDQRAEDAVQQTFVRALLALRAGTEVRDLAPWLHRIARNVSLGELSARQGDQTELSEDWEDRSRSDECERRARLSDTLVAVAALPDRQRTALLRSVAGDTPAAIAHELGMTNVAARQLVHRARATVRAAVQVISPPPLIWVSRRFAAAWERVPRAAGVPAGAAPLVSKIAVVVVASATVAAPVTVFHGILNHPVKHPARASRVTQATLADAPSSFPRLHAAAPSASPDTVVAPARRPPSQTVSNPAGSGPGVSASSPGAPVGAGSGPAGDTSGAASTGGAGASGAAGSSHGGLGPTSSASASAPTAAAASDTSGGPAPASSDASSGSASPAPTSTDATSAGSSPPAGDPSSSSAPAGSDGSGATGSPTP